MFSIKQGMSKNLFCYWINVQIFLWNTFCVTFFVFTKCLNYSGIVMFYFVGNTTTYNTLQQTYSTKCFAELPLPRSLRCKPFAVWSDLLVLLLIMKHKFFCLQKFSKWLLVSLIFPSVYFILILQIIED